MKSNYQIIINNYAAAAAVKKTIINLFVLCLFLLHVVLQNYIICIEKDGWIVLENAADKQYCCDASELSTDSDALIEVNTS